jgi:hypothetical protein
MKNTGPFTFIARNRLRPGALDAQRRRVPDLAAFVEESEPQLLAFNEYVDVTSGEVTVVQVHPDSRSMELHGPAPLEEAGRGPVALTRTEWAA